jgi:hypothetical protein
VEQQRSAQIADKRGEMLEELGRTSTRITLAAASRAGCCTIGFRLSSPARSLSSAVEGRRGGERAGTPVQFTCTIKLLYKHGSVAGPGP